MEIVVGIIIVVTVIGAIVAGIFGVAVFAVLWWIIIPIICGMVGGPIGFCFGLGLVAIIGLIIAAVKS